MLIMKTKPTRHTLQSNKGCRKPYGRILVSMILVLSLFCLPSRGTCEMAAMTDDELAQVTGHGFSEFSLTNVNGVDIARIDLNLQASTYATMDSLKMGYWDNNGSGTAAWDQNWLGVSFGSDAADMVLSGFVLQAEFTDIDDAATRELKSITMGFESVTGTLSANFASLSELTADVSRDSTVGVDTYTFNGGPFMLHINVDGANPGIWFDFGTATRN